MYLLAYLFPFSVFDILTFFQLAVTGVHGVTGAAAARRVTEVR